MKTKYKYIHFVPGAGTFDPDWTIWNNKTNDYLGELKYNVKWKEHELCPEPRTGWTIQCLLDVADFIKQLPTTKGGRVQPQVIAKTAGIEFRPNIDDIDEIVADNCRLHLEYMDNDLIWMDIELPNGDEYHVNIYHRNGKTKAWLKTSGEKVG